MSVTVQMIAMLPMYDDLDNTLLPAYSAARIHSNSNFVSSKYNRFFASSGGILEHWSSPLCTLEVGQSDGAPPHNDFGQVSRAHCIGHRAV